MNIQFFEPPRKIEYSTTSPLLGLIAALGLVAVSAHAVPPSEELQQRIIEISEAVKPSVVHIEAIVRVNDRRNQVTGSGLIASASGLARVYGTEMWNPESKDPQPRA